MEAIKKVKEAIKPIGFNEFAWKTYQALCIRIITEQASWNEVVPIPNPEIFELISINGHPVIEWKYLKFLHTESNSEWVEILVLEARNQLKSNRFDAVADLLNLAERIHPNNEETLLYQAILSHKTGKIHSALHYYHRLISLNPKSDIGYSRRALMYYQLKMNDKALWDVNKSLFLNPQNELALRVKVGLCVLEGEFEMAEKVITQMIKINPYEEKYFEKLADIQILLEKFQQAKITLDHLLRINPSNIFANYELAILLSKNKQTASQAKVLLQKAYKLGYNPKTEQRGMVA